MTRAPTAQGYCGWRNWLRARRVQCDAQGQAGFTLIELVIVSAIMPLVIGGISVALISTLRDQVTAVNSTTDSADLNTTAAYFVRDVESATQIATVGAGNACAGPSGYANDKLLLGLSWLSPGGATTYVSYWQTSTGAISPTSTYDIYRSACVGAAAPTFENLTTQTSATSPPVVTVTCESGSCPTGWYSAAGVSSVSLFALQTASGLPFNIEAVPRLWSSTIAGETVGGTVLPPLLLTWIGAPSCPASGGDPCLIEVANSGATLNVSGGNIDLDYLGGYTGSAPLVWWGASGAALTNPSYGIQVYDCGSQCGAVVQAESPGYTGTVTALSSAVAQPNTPTSPPPTSGGAPGSCTGTTTVTCTPGVYASGLMLSTPSANVTFDPGNYLFSGGALDIAGSGETITLGAGDYTFDGGFEDGGSGNTITSGSGGVFFDMAGGALDLTDATSKITLTAPTSGPYENLLFYQPSGDTSPVTVASSSAFANNLTGAIEAPGAEISITLSSDPLTLDGSVVGSYLVANGTGTATIG